MALVPTRATASPDRPAPRPPNRLPTRVRRRLHAALEEAMAELSADAVLLAGCVTDTVAALAAGLWTPAHAARSRPPAPEPRAVADELGLTLHTVPGWHLAEGRSIAADELGLDASIERERAARLAAAAAAARRHGADRVLAGAGAAPIHEACLSLAQARACVERYGLALVTPFAHDEVRACLADVDERWTSGRWRGRYWPAWALREAVSGRVSARLAWPMGDLGGPRGRG